MARPTLTGLEDALAQAGGLDAPPESAARLRDLLGRELEHGERELGEARSGYVHPVVVAVGAGPGALVGVAPVPARLAADPGAASERAWLLTAALTGALVAVAGEGAGAALRFGEAGGRLCVAVPAREPEPELAAMQFEEYAGPVDRLRARPLALPGHALAEAAAVATREPLSRAHAPLLVAAQVAALGGNPADPASVAEHEEAILAAAEASPGAARPHDDHDPGRRVARRILQRLNGMGKWGGYHTEFSHLARGFSGNDRALAERVGEALLDSGLLAEKQSVGQRHVFLNPRRAGDVHQLIDEARIPNGLHLPQ